MHSLCHRVGHSCRFVKVVTVNSDYNGKHSREGRVVRRRLQNLECLSTVCPMVELISGFAYCLRGNYIKGSFQSFHAKHGYRRVKHLAVQHQLKTGWHCPQVQG